MPAQHRLSAGNPTFRGNMLVPEGAARRHRDPQPGQTACVLQDLPFDIELKKFIVDYYATGMPKLFASEIVIHDRDTGEQMPAHGRRSTSRPFHRGVAIYQCSFDDGGSELKLQAVPMAGGGKPFEIEGTVGGSTQLHQRQRASSRSSSPACA